VVGTILGPYACLGSKTINYKVSGKGRKLPHSCLSEYFYLHTHTHTHTHTHKNNPPVRVMKGKQTSEKTDLMKIIMAENVSGFPS
jgi:hypothetical protein